MTATMDKVTHSPGPWKLDSEYGDEIVDARGNSVAECRGGRFVSSEAGGPADQFELPARTAANARLVAAAPEMLAALELIAQFAREVLTANRVHGDLGCPNAHLAEIRDVAALAIRNARGEQ